jgi:DNA-3-methyladenine glycosylase I
MVGAPQFRCPWAGDDPLYVAYHDEEWGAPKIDDRALFEKLILEGFQAGLSWITILRKRPRFRTAFDDFDAERIVRWDQAKVAALMADSGIVRNRLKIAATIDNARAYLALREKQDLARFLWDFVDGAAIQNQWRTLGDVPPQTPLSARISKALKAQGFRFVGPTTVYAFMQSVGMVNDHLVACWRHESCARLAHPWRRATPLPGGEEGKTRV